MSNNQSHTQPEKSWGGQILLALAVAQCEIDLTTTTGFMYDAGDSFLITAGIR